jgi:hypothetical protein
VALIHQKSGELQAALVALRRARAHAEEHGHARLTLRRTIDEGGILLALDQPPSAVKTLRGALGAAVTAGDRLAEFHAHYWLWKAHLALTEAELAAYELAAARQALRFVDENSEEAQEVRALQPEAELRAGKRGRPKRKTA